MSEPKWDWRGLWIGIPRADKRVWTFLLAGVILAAIWAIGGWLRRYDFSEVLVPFSYREESIEAVREVEIKHRSYVIEAPVRWVYELRAADVIIPSRVAFGVGFLLLVIGWGSLLTAATRMQGFWPYVIYFGWIAWLYLSGSAEAWAGVDPFYVISLGLSLVVLIPAYLIQVGIWRLSLRYTGLLLYFLVGVVLGTPALWRGESVFHDSVAYPGIVSLAASVLVFLQGGIAWSAFVVYGLSRWRAGILGYGIWALVSVMVGVGLWVLPQEVALSAAVWIGIGGAVIGFIGLQPFFPLWSEGFRQPIAFFWGWLGLIGISLSSFGYHSWAHQDLYIYRIATLARDLLGASFPMMALYLGVNFWPLWKQRRMNYWELHRSMRIPLAFVYFVQLGTVVFWEARSDWPTSRLPARLYAVLRAESALLRGEWEAAKTAYQEAALFLPYEAKLNYNLGRLEAQEEGRAEAACERYDRALLSKPFLPAVLQSSLVWLALDRPVRAIQVLQSYHNRFGGNADLYNQLAFAFYKGGQLDSAAYYWKEAIRKEPSEERYYTHLALLYARYGRPAWAQKVVQRVLPSASPVSSVQENLAYLYLLGIIDSLPYEPVQTWNGQWIGLQTDTGAVGRFIAAVRRRDFSEAQGFLPYFRTHDPEVAPRLARFLAVALSEEGLARPACELFLSAGTPVDSLYAAYALADAGCLDAAYGLVSRLWVSYPDLEEKARKEAALLLSAAGHLSEATLLEPLQNWKDKDYLRFARYAYHRKAIQIAVLVLRPWVEKGAVYDEPYEVVARLFLEQGDTAGAEENIAAGLAKKPSSAILRALRAEVALAKGHVSAARAEIDSLRSFLATRTDSLYWCKVWLQLNPSLEEVERARAVFPVFPPLQVAWASSLLRERRFEEAYRFLGAALEVNPYDKGLWEAYREAALALGLQEEADFASRKPDLCPPVP
ncbi:MAG: hypothetical protein N2170_08440 [Bacteroidia bacterium]|nr:hypothetical protein [Bacteroidia bacterium]